MIEAEPRYKMSQADLLKTSSEAQSQDKTSEALLKDQLSEVEIMEKIEKSNRELHPVLNFVSDANESVLEIPGRENFFENLFYKFDTVYHTVDKWDRHQLKCYILIPKQLDIDKKVLVHCLFHGGGFRNVRLTSLTTTGGGLYVHWFPDYKRDLAIRSNAITLVPMHRLMPEDSGSEIMDDIAAWWDFYRSEKCTTWITSCLEAANIKGKPDLARDRLLISGESSGGFLAVHSWLTQGEALPIQALYLQYPMLNYYERDIPSTGISYMGENLDPEWVAARTKALMQLVRNQREDNRLVSRSDTPPPFGMSAAMGLSTTKLWEEAFMAKRPILDTPAFLRWMKDKGSNLATLPKIFIIHGTEDLNCPIKNTREFVYALKKLATERGQKLEIAFTEFVTLGKENQEDYQDKVAHAFDYKVKYGTDPAVDKILEGIYYAW